MTSPAWAAHLPPGVAPEGVDLLVDRSLARSWTRRWAEDGDRRVVHDGHAGWVTAAQLEERSRAIARRLAGAGLVRGDRMVLSAPASLDLVVAHVAALRLGLVVVPMNTAYTEREVAHVVRDARPAAAVVDDMRRARWITDAAPSSRIVLTGPDVTLPRGVMAPSLDAVDSGDPALLVYTSGTTGPPKGALLSHGNLLASAEAVRLAWRWSPDDALVLALPLFHVHGLGVGLHGTLTAGAAVVLRSSFAVDDILDAAASHHASLFFGVPTMYARLAASSRVAELHALRLCVSGSAPMAADLHAAIARLTGQRVLERYGMSETVMNVSNPYDGERRAGTVGLPLPHVDVRLDAPSGEIHLRGPNVFERYWERPDATAEAFDADGWFHTGDVGDFDEDGYLRIVGRRKELIISGGYNVYPREIEDVLRAHPGVEDAAVIGVPDPEWGERVVAYIEGGAAADDVVAFAATRLAGYKRPRDVRVVDRLPRNALGKVLKDQLPGVAR